MCSSLENRQLLFRFTPKRTHKLLHYTNYYYRGAVLPDIPTRCAPHYYIFVLSRFTSENILRPDLILSRCAPILVRYYGKNTYFNGENDNNWSECLERYVFQIYFFFLFSYRPSSSYWTGLFGQDYYRNGWCMEMNSSSSSLGGRTQIAGEARTIMTK